MLSADTSDDVATRAAKTGLAQLLDASLVTGDGDAWSVNAALALTALRHDPDPVRQDLLRRRLASTLGHREREGRACP